MIGFWGRLDQNGIVSLSLFAMLTSFYHDFDDMSTWFLCSYLRSLNRSSFLFCFLLLDLCFAHHFHNSNALIPINISTITMMLCK